MGLFDKDMTEQFLDEQTPSYGNFWSELMNGKKPQKTLANVAANPQVQAQAQQSSPGLFAMGQQIAKQQQATPQAAPPSGRPKTPQYNLLERMLYTPSSINNRVTNATERQLAWDEAQKAKAAIQGQQQFAGSLKDPKYSMASRLIASGDPDAVKKGYAMIEDINKIRQGKSPTMTKIGVGNSKQQSGYFKPGTSEWVPMGKPTGSRGQTINVGGTNVTPGWMPDEVKEERGIPKANQLWQNSKGEYSTVYKPTEKQQAVETGLSQMEFSTAGLNSVLNEYNPESLTNLFANNVNIPEDMKNYLRSDASKRVNFMKKGWQENVLRDATGAVINQSEYDDYDIMFMPQAWDTDEDKELKAQARHVKENAWRKRVGKPEEEYVSPYKKKGKKQTPSEKWKEERSSQLDERKSSVLSAEELAELEELEAWDKQNGQ